MTHDEIIFEYSIPEDNCKVVHCKKSKFDVYIGRPSKWGNHGAPITIVKNCRINHWGYFNDETNEIKKFTFDVVHIDGLHGFCGTSFSYLFFLNNESVNIGIYTFAPTVEELKTIKLKEINHEIARIDRLNEERQKLVDKINLIESL